MKIKFNPETGVLKVRPSLGTALGVGLTLAGIKIVYDLATATYFVGVRRVSDNLPAWQEKVEQKLEEVKEQAEAAKESSDGVSDAR